MKAYLSIFLFLSANIQANPLDEMFDAYQQSGVRTIDSEQGKSLWNEAFITEKSKDKERSCANCHGSDVTKKGEHLRTGKVIEPMAKSVNAKRYTNTKKIKKWFKRNCKWTLGRECSAQEQADILKYLITQ